MCYMNKRFTYLRIYLLYTSDSINVLYSYVRYLSRPSPPSCHLTQVFVIWRDNGRIVTSEDEILIKVSYRHTADLAVAL